jgi:hypothetical protein
MANLVATQSPHTTSLTLREHTPVIFSIPNTPVDSPQMEQPRQMFHSLLVHRTPTLESLPAEIINCIAQHVRALSQDFDDYMPRVPRVCPCKPITALRRAHAQVKSLGCYQDAALALSMTCTRMKEIVFEAQLGRSVRIGLCDAAMDASRGISGVLRSHVR